MDKESLENVRKAGKITAQARDYGKTLIKEGISVRSIIEKIEAKMFELGGKPAFPVQLSLNETAAHFLPSEELILKEGDLVKLDLGAQIDGFLADTAVTVEIKSNNHKELINASQAALDNAAKILKAEIEIYKIGDVIEKAINGFKFNPIVNLSGHSIDRYVVHSGLTIPNFNNGNNNRLEKGTLIAIEPFATNGSGKVFESKPSGVYRLINIRPVRDAKVRKILEFINSEYNVLPFSKYWLVKKFGLMVNLALTVLEREGIVYSYPQLVEKTRGLISQAEHTFYIGDKVELITKSE